MYPCMRVYKVFRTKVRLFMFYLAYRTSRDNQIVDGDIMIPRVHRNRRNVVSKESFLWTSKQIPYEIDASGEFLITDH